MGEGGKELGRDGEQGKAGKIDIRLIFLFIGFKRFQMNYYNNNSFKWLLIKEAF